MKDKDLLIILGIIFSAIVTFCIFFVLFAYQAGFFKLVVADNKKPPKQVSFVELENMASVLEKEKLASEREKKELEEKKAQAQELNNQVSVEEKGFEDKKAELAKIIEDINKGLEVNKSELQKKYAVLAKVYTSMKPDKVAQVMEKMDDAIVVGILSQMKPKISAKILERLKPSRAGTISAKIK